MEASQHDDESDYGFDQDIFNILVTKLNTTTSPSTSFARPAAPEIGDHQSTALASVLDPITENGLILDEEELASGAFHRHVAADGSHSAKHDHKRKLSPSASRDDAQIAAFIAKTKARTTPIVLADADVSYPDLSRAFANVRDAQPVAKDLGSDPPGPKDDGSPILRFRTFPKKPFSVTDLTAGYWCELQYYYTLTRLPGGRKTKTPSMKAGTKIHKKLEEELYTTVRIKVKKKEDAFGLRVWNIIQGLRTLRETGMTRELEIWGFVDGNIVIGCIDLLTHQNPDPELGDHAKSSASSQGSKQAEITRFFAPDRPTHKEVFVTDIKTRASASPPSKSAAHQTLLQLFLYHRLLSDMAADKVDYMRVFERYGLNPDELFSDKFLSQVGQLHDEVLTDAPSTQSTSESSSSLEVESAVFSSAQTPCQPGILNYRSLRALTALLILEVRLTFPRGAGSLGQVVSVEYHQQLGVEDDRAAKSNSKVINTSAHFVQPWILDEYITECLQWWRGEREPRGVSLQDAFKCRSCEFAGDCEWRDRLDKEALGKAKAKLLGAEVQGSPSGWKRISKCDF